MANKIYVGNGWSHKFGVNISVKKEELDKLPVNKYGDILLEVVQLRELNEKTKATHYVAVNAYAYGKAGIHIGTSEDDIVKPSDSEDMPF